MFTGGMKYSDMGASGATARLIPRLRRPELLCAAALSVLLYLLGAAAVARADTTFGGNPAQAVTPGLSCAGGAPPYFYGAPSCTWSWASVRGSDGAPFPETTGGVGEITSVTLPAMPDPGPMQAVVITSTQEGSSIPSEPNVYCCQIPEISPTFTVPPNQVTTVPLNMAISSQEVPNLAIQGERGSFDGMAISVLSPTASLPLLYTGRTLIGSGADRDSAYFPAPEHTSSEYAKPTDPTGYELLASFNLGSTPAPPAPAPPAGADGGLKLTHGPLQVGQNGKTVTLGKAANPPTANTTQTLTAPAAARAASAGLSKAKKPILFGSGKTKVPAGKMVGVKLNLNGAARAKLKKTGSLKATLTIVAANPQGEMQTTTESIKIKPGAHRGKKK
jgi:hypothetical protein